MRELIDIERRYRTLSKRAGLYEALEQAFRRNFYDSAEDAADRARTYRDLTDALEAEDLSFDPTYNGGASVLSVLSDKASLRELIDQVNRRGDA